MTYERVRHCFQEYIDKRGAMCGLPSLIPIFVPPSCL